MFHHYFTGEKRSTQHVEMGYTQEQLSFESGIELRQIGRIERGEINTGINSVFEIAEILKINPKDLFDF